MKKLLAFLLISVAIFSCEKNNDPDSGMVTLLNFGPTGAMPGDTLRFFGNRLDEVTEIQFTGTGATVPAANFIQRQSDLILLKVPIQTEQGFVTLKTPAGDIVSKTRFNLQILPTIATITTQARPGENITIAGQYLNWVSSVTFANAKQVDTFVSRTLTQLVVKVPADAQTGPLILSYGGTKAEKMQTKDTVKVALPQATGMTPNPAKHADNLTIAGTNLDLVMKVMFPGVTAPVTTFVSKTATQLVVKIPGAATKGKLTLEAASGVPSMTSADLDILIPVLTAMSPNPVDPGGRLTITGSNLNLVSSVTFSNAPAVTSFVSQTAGQMVVAVPMGVLKGKITLGVLNSTVVIQSNDVLDVTGSAPDPTISFPIYKDAVTANWNGWIGGGWGGTANRDNIAPVREGAKSVKIDYVGGFGSPLQLGGANINVAGFTTFKLSVFGAPGSADKKINIGINGSDSPYTITVVEGKWTDYEIPLSTLSLSATNSLKEIWIKEASGTGGFTVYVDALGLN